MPVVRPVAEVRQRERAPRQAGAIALLQEAIGDRRAPHLTLAHRVPRLAHCSTRMVASARRSTSPTQRTDQRHVGDGPVADQRPGPSTPTPTSWTDLARAGRAGFERAAAPRGVERSTRTAVDRDRPGRLAGRVGDQDLIARHQADLQDGEQEHQDDREQQGQLDGGLPAGHRSAPRPAVTRDRGVALSPRLRDELADDRIEQLTDLAGLGRPTRRPAARSPRRRGARGRTRRWPVPPLRDRGRRSRDRAFTT